MICPNCQTLCGENDRFCYLCGTPLQPEAEPPKPKKGSHWVPILILIVMSIAGIVLYFAAPGVSAPANTVAVFSSSEPWFSVQDGVLYFYESLYTGGSELTVPSQINGESVHSLSAGCFANCTELTTVILPDTLQVIDQQAFYGCTSLRGIFIPSSVMTIGAEAFYGCTDLESVCLHDSLFSIGRDAFDDCNYLRYIFFSGT